MPEHDRHRRRRLCKTAHPRAAEVLIARLPDSGARATRLNPQVALRQE